MICTITNIKSLQDKITSNEYQYNEWKNTGARTDMHPKVFISPNCVIEMQL